jgi:uncharacterized membrane protein
LAALIVLIVLFVSWLVFRGPGALDIAAFASWHLLARFALAVMFVFTGLAHFTRTKHDMARMVPSGFPQPVAMVYFTGICEWLGAIGLLAAKTREAAAVALIVMPVAIFPANIRAAREALTVGGRPATRLWLRAPMQILFIARSRVARLLFCVAQRSQFRDEADAESSMGQSTLQERGNVT